MLQFRRRVAAYRQLLCIAYGSLMMEMCDKYSGSVTPSTFKRAVGHFAPQFMGYRCVVRTEISSIWSSHGAYIRQQDSQEFLRFLLDGLHEDLNSVRGKKPYRELPDFDEMSDDEASQIAWDYHLRLVGCMQLASESRLRSFSRNNSQVVGLFGGQLMSRVECGSCHHISKAFDPFLDLSVPIPEGGSSGVGNANTVIVVFFLSSPCSLRTQGFFSRSRVSSKAHSLEDCLNLFTAAETLSGNDKFYCSKCMLCKLCARVLLSKCVVFVGKKHRKSTKQLSVYRLPRVLVLHLKRFKFTSRYRTKVDKTNFAVPYLNIEISGALQISTNITFPKSGLDVAAHCTTSNPGSTVYDLFAVSNHSGGNPYVLRAMYAAVSGV